MPIESYSSEEPVSDLNGSPNSIEALRAPEIKLILRAFSVDPVLILDAKTKMDLVELARHHGITSMPDEWTLQKLKSKECGLEEALSQQQHYDGIEHNKSAGFKQPAPIEEDEDDEESLVVSTGRGRAQAKKKKKTPKKKHLKSNRDSLAKSMREYGLSLDDLKAVLNQAAKASQHEAEVAEALASDERNVVVSAMNTLGLSVDEIRKVLVDVRR